MVIPDYDEEPWDKKRPANPVEPQGVDDYTVAKASHRLCLQVLTETECENSALVAEISRLSSLLHEARAALEKIYECMGGDEHDGWETPEDVWEIAKGALAKLSLPASPTQERRDDSESVLVRNQDGTVTEYPNAMAAYYACLPHSPNIISRHDHPGAVAEGQTTEPGS